MSKNFLNKNQKRILYKNMGILLALTVLCAVFVRRISSVGGETLQDLADRQEQETTILENDTASVLANLSRKGVTAAGFPMCPMVSQRISSGLNMIIFGRFPISSSHYLFVSQRPHQTSRL